jgi:hypothetical protein
MKIRRSIAAGTLALTTVVTVGPLASAASAQAEPSTTVPAVVSCKKVSQQYRKVTRRLSKAARRLSFWQKVAAEMPARIEAQQATVTDLQAQLAAATGDAATAIQTQLDNATTKLAWMQAKLEASGRRVPAWTDAVARLSALQTTLNDKATTGNCPLPTTTTAPANEEGDDNGGSSTSSTSSTVPGDDSGNDLGDDKGGERTDDRSDNSPSSTFEDRTAAERVAEAQRKAAERQAEAQRKAAERQAEAQRKAAERVAEAQKRAAEAQRKAAESGRRNRGGQSPTTSPAPTVDDRGGSSGRDGNDD